MTTEGFVVSHASDATFERGLRSFYEYRDLGIKTAPQGRVDAHVIRGAAGCDFSSQPHRRRTQCQRVYILKGWTGFHELGHSDDIDMLEVVLPAGFATEQVASANG